MKPALSVRSDRLGVPDAGGWQAGLGQVAVGLAGATEAGCAPAPPQGRKEGRKEGGGTDNFCSSRLEPQPCPMAEVFLRGPRRGACEGCFPLRGLPISRGAKAAVAGAGVQLRDALLPLTSSRPLCSSCGPECWVCWRAPPPPLPALTETAHGPQLFPSGRSH